MRLDAPDLELLAHSPAAGVYLAASRDGRRVFATGHPEYDAGTLDAEYRRDLATSQNSLGTLLSNLGQRAEAEEQYRKALAIQEKLALAGPVIRMPSAVVFWIVPPVVALPEPVTVTVPAVVL